MPPPPDHRSHERIPIRNRVKILSEGRIIAHASARNISLGDVLIHTSHRLSLGSKCQLAIYHPGGREDTRVMMEGAVARIDGDLMAVVFTQPLPEAALQAFANPVRPLERSSFARDFLHVIRDPNLGGCEALLGIRKRTLRRTFVATFALCTCLAMLFLWLLREPLQDLGAPLRFSLCFLHGAFWILLVQPGLELGILSLLRSRTRDIP